MQPVVLFIDDDPSFLAIIRRSMQQEHFRVCCAESTEAARNILAADPVDLVVCDEHMPGTSGSEFLAEIRQSHPDTIRMMLSGKATVGAVVQAINAGEVFRFLLKPCSQHDLVATIRQGLAHKAFMENCQQSLLLFRHQNDILQRIQQQAPELLELIRNHSPARNETLADSMPLETLTGEFKLEIERSSGLHVAISRPATGAKSDVRAATSKPEKSM